MGVSSTLVTFPSRLVSSSVDLETALRMIDGLRPTEVIEIQRQLGEWGYTLTRKHLLLDRYSDKVTLEQGRYVVR